MALKDLPLKEVLFSGYAFRPALTPVRAGLIAAIKRIPGRGWRSP